MRRSPVTWLLVALGLLSFAGCGSSQSFSPLGAIPPSAIGSTRSWMSPDAKRRDLLYVSDFQNNDVSVFSYPEGKLKGTLTGFTEPYGECADAAGDIFIANGSPPEILEYAHGGTTPIATLDDPGQYPYSCSVDPTTGDLAVTNEYTRSSAPGTVAIYKHATGTPHLYGNAGFHYMFFCGYDNRGNLFVDGQTPPASNGFVFAELPKGGSKLKTINLNVTINFPGGVQWDGQYVAVGDQVGSLIYQFTISGKTGTREGVTHLGGSIEIVEFWKQGGDIAGPDANSAEDRVGLWKYPAGGTAIKYLTNQFGLPVGTTVSKAP